MTTTQKPLTGIARELVAAELLSEQDAREALNAAKEKNVSLIKYLSESKQIDPVRLAEVAAFAFGMPLFDLSAFDLELIPLDAVSPDLIAKHRVLPLFKRGNRLFVAVSDPTQTEALEEIRFNTGTNTDPVMVTVDALEAAIEGILAKKEQEDLAADLGDVELDEADFETTEERDEDPAAGADDKPIVKFVKKILFDAINKGASDLHFEPYEKSYRVRFRIDGVLQEVATAPPNMAGRIAARLKVISKLNIAERRVPQDGRVKLRLSKNRTIDFRVSTLPTLFGEKVVMRILDPESAKLGIDALGYEPEQKKLYLDALHKPQGMILVTGPTGSGKTVSLYTGVNILNTPERNISTAEDPVEINLPGVNQVNINPAQGLTFASALRAFLRQDPDVILVGEIRDLETAEIAIKAAQTGHLVLSTLHTNSAPETLTRLLNMGVAPFNIATTVNLVIAQRLARRLCTHCKRPADVPRNVLLDFGFREDEVDNLTIYEAVGCDKCTNGYKGRVGIYQVMPVTESISRLIMENGNAIQIADQAKAEGIPDLRASALEKARQGIIDLKEVNRVTQD